jgi:hypothetical protein
MQQNYIDINHGFVKRNAPILCCLCRHLARLFPCLIYVLTLFVAAKLKDLGNSVLGRFGMSVDNFKAVKDPNTGSYSLSFEK